MASSRSLGSLTLDLIANIGGFIDGMSKASRAAQKSLNEIEKDVGEFSENIAKLLEFAGITVGVDALIDGVKEAIEQMDQLGKSAQKVGLPVEQFSALAGAAKLSDVSTDDLTTTLTRLSATLGKATNGSSEQAKLFKALGISITDVSGNLRSTQDVMSDYADRLKELGVNSTTTAAGIELFGKNYQNLIPFLEKGSEGMKEAEEDAISLGAALAGQAAEAAAKFDDNMNELTLATQGLKNQLVQALLPTLNDWTNSLVGIAKNQQDVENIATGLAGALRGLELVANAVAAGFAFIQATIETLTVAIANGVQHFRDYADIASLAVTNPAAALKVAQAAAASNTHNIATDAQAASDTVAKSWSDAVDKMNAAFDRMGHNLNDPLTAPIKNATKGVVDLSQKVNDLATGNVKSSKAFSSTAAQIAALGGAAVKAGEDVGQVQSVISAAIAKLSQNFNGRDTLKGIQAALNPEGAAQADKIAAAMQRLGDAVAKVNESTDPTQKAYSAYADTVRQIDQLGAAAIKAGANVVQVQNLVAQGVSSAQQKLANDLAAPIKATKDYEDALNAQLDAQKDKIALQVQSIGLGTQEAANQAAINNVIAQGAKAVTDYTKQNSALLGEGDVQTTKRLADLKQYWADVLQTTKDGQVAVADAQADWMNGVTQAWHNFLAQQNNVAKIANDLTTDFFNGASSSLSDFISGTKSASDALKSFLQSFEQQIDQAVSKQLLKSLFSIGDSSGGSGGGIFGAIGDFLGGGGFGGSGSFFGHANGGLAPSNSISRVNERGPELLTVGGKDYLMMGGQNGRITPNDRISRAGVSQNNNFYLAAPTSQKTQNQIANKLSYQQRLAQRLV
jgi:lambda family phage tail tape measure protein